MEMEKKKGRGYAFIPFAVFIGFYLISGIVLQARGVEMAFYQIPSSISIIIGVVSAFLLFKGSVDHKVNSFLKGCGDENIIIMCIIYLLAGAFSTVSEKMGGVDSVVNLCLSVIPLQFVVAGLFLIAVFISTATGTSIGAMVALGSISVGLAQKGNINVALMLGALVGGSLAGDNLSIISDTTIAATRTQNVENRDKFIMNSKISIPAIIITTVLLLVMGRPENTVSVEIGSYSLLKILPYLFVLVTAVMGMNVFLVLFSGIVISGAVGMFYGSFDFITLTQQIFNGFAGMLDIFVLSMFTGGLANMVREEGGITWVTEKIKGFINSRKSAEISFSAMTFLTDLAVANNTVSILITGPVAKDMSKKYEVDPRRIASLIDIFSCVGQGIIPYGAQLLIAAGLTAGAVSPVQIIPYVWYLFLLAFFAILSIFVRFTDLKDKWNYEYDMPESEVIALGNQEKPEVQI